MLIESGMGCCCQKEDALFWKNRHIDAMKQLVQVRQENLELRKQLDIYMSIKKDLDEKLDKAAADYKALWVEHEEKISNAAESYAKLAIERNNLAETVSRMEKTIRDLDEHNGTLRSQLAGAKAQCENTVENRQRISELSQTVINLREEVKRRKDCGKKLSDAYTKLIEENAELQKKLDSAEKESDDLLAMYDKVQAEAHQAKVAKDSMGYSNSCMQSKIAKQSNEIKRLTEENEKLRDHHAKMSNMIDKLNDDASDKEILYHDLWLEKNSLKKALDTAAKDAGANFDRGYRKGMDELWNALRKVQDEPLSVLTDAYGQSCMYDCISKLSAHDFAMKTMEWEDKKAKDIQIGDEVEIFDSHDCSLSDIGIVIAIDKDHPCFTVIGPKFEGCFDETDIDSGRVRKTGQHFDSIPLNYFA